MEKGWIKLHRSILDSSICPKKKFSRFEAWIYILLSANHEPKKWQGILIYPGELVTSQKELAVKWGWSLGGVNKFLTWLKSESKSEIKTTNKYTIISVINWSKYQKSESKSEIKVKSKRKQSENKVKQLKNIKNDKNERKKSINTFHTYAQTILQVYNFIFDKGLKSTKGFESNLEYWLDTYDVKDIANAMLSARADEWWSARLTPTILFRRKNPNGEPVDWIGTLLNKKNTSKLDDKTYALLERKAKQVKKLLKGAT